MSCAEAATHTAATRHADGRDFEQRARTDTTHYIKALGIKAEKHSKKHKKKMPMQSGVE